MIAIMNRIGPQLDALLIIKQPQDHDADEEFRQVVMYKANAACRFARERSRS